MQKRQTVIDEVCAHHGSPVPQRFELTEAFPLARGRRLAARNEELVGDPDIVSALEQSIFESSS